MRESQFKAIARARLRWLTPDEGGRRPVPLRPIFAATARFDSDVLDRDLSIVIRHTGNSPESGASYEADISFLAPELIANRLAPGLRFSVLEGPRVVAEGLVLESLHASP